MAFFEKRGLGLKGDVVGRHIVLRAAKIKRP
jgi:hypothetical protein